MKLLLDLEYYSKYDLSSIEKQGIELIDIYGDYEPSEIDIILAYLPFEKHELSAFTNLKWVQTSSVSVNQLPLEEMAKRGIRLSNNRGSYSTPIAEFIVMRLLEIYKNSRSLHHLQNNKQWPSQKIETEELSDKKILFVGAGSIAKETVKKMIGFQTVNIAVDPYATLDPLFQNIYPLDALKDTVKKADVVILTAPYTAQTHHMFNRDVLACLQSHAILINVSRGALIDEKALIEALSNRRFRAAVLDVFEQEPLPAASPLWAMDQVFISPHMSYYTKDSLMRTFQLIHDNMIRFMNDQVLINEIDYKKGF